MLKGSKYASFTHVYMTILKKAYVTFKFKKVLSNLKFASNARINKASCKCLSNELPVLYHIFYGEIFLF